MSDRSHARTAPRPWQFEVHLPCARLRGWAGRVQGCPCAPADAWPDCDVSRAQDLCVVCARGTAGGTTRWSWLACTDCRSVERALQDRLGIRVLPLGRHSLMNGVGLRVAAASEAEAAAFAVRFEGLGLGWDRLFDWGAAEARRLADSLGADAPAVPLETWQRAFPPSVEASLDAYERILGTPVPVAVREGLRTAAADR